MYIEINFEDCGCKHIVNRNTIVFSFYEKLLMQDRLTLTPTSFEKSPY